MGLDPNFVAEWKVAASEYSFQGVPVNKLNRDELCAVVVFLLSDSAPVQVPA